MNMHECNEDNEAVEWEQVCIYVNMWDWVVKKVLVQKWTLSGW